MKARSISGKKLRC